MVSKYDVKEWVNKCQRRAIESVVNKYEEEFRECIAYTDLESLLTRIIDFQDWASEIKDELVENGLDKITVSTSVHGYGYYYDNRDANLAIIAAIVKANPDKYKKEFEIIKKFETKLSEVKTEYNNLLNQIDKMKADRAIKFLQETGFDTSSLIPNIKELDKAKLFVCGDNKPNV